MKKLVITALILSFAPWNLTQAATLQAQAVTLNNSVLPRNGVRVPFISLNLKALEGPITVETLTVERSGLSSSDDFGRIWAETDSYRRTHVRQLSNDDQVELAFRNGLNIEENEVVRLYVYANLQFSSGGRTAQLNLVDIKHDGDTPPTEEPAPENTDKVRTKPSQSLYDRSKYRIKCTRGQCRLVPRS